MTRQSMIDTKKKFKEKATGKHITDYTFDGGIFPEKEVGKGITVAGPYPVHKWYAQVDTDENGVVVRVR